MQTNKQQEIEKTQKQHLSNSEQVNAVARNHTSQIAYMPLLTIGLSNICQYGKYRISLLRFLFCLIKPQLL